MNRLSPSPTPTPSPTRNSTQRQQDIVRALEEEFNYKNIATTENGRLRGKSVSQSSSVDEDEITANIPSLKSVELNTESACSRFCQKVAIFFRSLWQHKMLLGSGFLLIAAGLACTFVDVVGFGVPAPFLFPLQAASFSLGSSCIALAIERAWNDAPRIEHQLLHSQMPAGEPADEQSIIKLKPGEKVLQQGGRTGNGGYGGASGTLTVLSRLRLDSDRNLDLDDSGSNSDDTIHRTDSKLDRDNATKALRYANNESDASTSSLSSSTTSSISAPTSFGAKQPDLGILFMQAVQRNLLTESNSASATNVVSVGTGTPGLPTTAIAGSTSSNDSNLRPDVEYGNNNSTISAMSSGTERSFSSRIRNALSNLFNRSTVPQGTSASSNSDSNSTAAMSTGASTSTSTSTSTGTSAAIPANQPPQVAPHS